MAVYRANMNSCYTQVSNELINNTYLSAGAFRLLLKMLSKPCDWKFSLSGLAFMCKLGVTSIKKYLAELKKFGHVVVTQKRDDHGRIDYEYDVYEIPQKNSTKPEMPVERPQAKKQPSAKQSPVSPQAVKVSTVYHYNTNNNKTNKKDKNRVSETCEKVLSHLNVQTGRNYKVNKNCEILIERKLKEGYSLEDFLKVVDKKCREWLKTAFESYLRPSTLFGDKFDEYLNAPEKVPEKPQNSNFNRQTKSAQNNFTQNNLSVDEYLAFNRSPWGYDVDKEELREIWKAENPDKSDFDFENWYRTLPGVSAI